MEKQKSSFVSSTAASYLAEKWCLCDNKSADMPHRSRVKIDGTFCTGRKHPWSSTVLAAALPTASSRRLSSSSLQKAWPPFSIDCNGRRSGLAAADGGGGRKGSKHTASRALPLAYKEQHTQPPSAMLYMDWGWNPSALPKSIAEHWNHATSPSDFARLDDEKWAKNTLIFAP